jgi:hypothetical protein
MHLPMGRIRVCPKKGSPIGLRSVVVEGSHLLLRCRPEQAVREIPKLMAEREPNHQVMQADGGPVCSAE